MPALHGCGGAGSAGLGAGSLALEPAPGGGTTTVVEADWNDVYAAALIALPQIEAAELAVEAQDSRTVVRFKTIHEREGTLTADRPGPPFPPADRPHPFRLTARIGIDGEPEREEALLRATAARLRDLAGRDWAPAR
ncbi:MAG: hypothetical protein WD749_05360 [Phycisphaerales bacterium]